MTAAPPVGSDALVHADPLLQVRGLRKYFEVRGKGVFRRTTAHVQAVDGIDFDLAPGETLGIVGESGCGKSTLGRTILQLIPATDGNVLYGGRDLTGLSKREMRELRQDLQIVFQDPYASLDPRMPVSAIVAEPLRIHGRYGDGGKARVRELLELVGLRAEHANRFPHEFSGGQRQRIGIARALALEPKVLILDEPVSALDVSIQAGIINLLLDLQERFGLSYLFVSHDLSVVKHLAHRVAVMHQGKIIEQGENDQLFANPQRDYTRRLLAAVPRPKPNRR
jgi:oligopeptide transport system ATP-binding protein